MYDLSNEHKDRTGFRPVLPYPEIGWAPYKDDLSRQKRHRVDCEGQRLANSNHAPPFPMSCPALREFGSCSEGSSSMPGHLHVPVNVVNRSVGWAVPESPLARKPQPTVFVAQHHQNVLSRALALWDRLRNPGLIGPKQAEESFNRDVINLAKKGGDFLAHLQIRQDFAKARQNVRSARRAAAHHGHKAPNPAALYQEMVEKYNAHSARTYR